MRSLITVLFVLALFSQLAFGEAVLHPFQVWPANQDYVQKASFYHGWTNGFFGGAIYGTDPELQSRIRDFGLCLEEKVTFRLAVAMIDTYYENHPESHEQPIFPMFLNALTAKGSPCEGMNPIE